MYPPRPARGESWFRIRRRSTCDPWGVCLQEADRNRPFPTFPGNGANLRVDGKSHLTCCFPAPFELGSCRSSGCEPLTVQPFPYDPEGTPRGLLATKRNNST